MARFTARLIAILSVIMLLVTAVPHMGASDASVQTDLIADEEYTTEFHLVHVEGTNASFTGGRNGDTPMALPNIMLAAENGDIYYLPAGSFEEASTITVSKSIKIVGEINDDGSPATKIKKGDFKGSKNSHLFSCNFRSSPLSENRGHVTFWNLYLDNDKNNVKEKANSGIQAFGNVDVDVYNTTIVNYNYYAAFAVNSANAFYDGNYYAVDTVMNTHGCKTENNIATAGLFALPRLDTLSTWGLISHAYFNYDNEDLSDFHDVDNFVMESSLTKRMVGYGNCLVNGYSLEEPTIGELVPKVRGGIYAEQKTTEQLFSGYECFKTIVDGRSVYVVTDDAVKITYDMNGGSGTTASSKWLKGSEAFVDLTNVPTKSGYVFAGWSTNSSASEPMYDASKSSFNIGENDVTLYAIYKQKQSGVHYITLDVGSGGTANYDSTSVRSGGDFSVVFLADTNFRIASVTVDGNDVGAVQAYILTNVTSDHTISVRFESAPGMETEIKDNTVIESRTEETSVGIKTEYKSTNLDDGSSIDTIVYTNEDIGVVTVSDRTNVQSNIESTKTVEETKDVASVTELQMRVAMQQTKELASTETPVIVIDTGEATSESIKKTDVKLVLNNDTKEMVKDNDVSIVTATGSVVLDSKSLEAAIPQGTEENVTITLSVGQPDFLTEEQKAVIGDNVVINAELLIQIGTSEPTHYTEKFEGEVTVQLKCHIDNPDNFKIYYVSDDGTTEEIADPTYDPETETVTFVAPHFSSYMISDVAPAPEKTVDMIFIGLLIFIAIAELIYMLWFTTRRKTA